MNGRGYRDVKKTERRIMSKTDKDSLSVEELNTLLAFSEGLYNNFSGFSFYANSFTQNQNLLKLNNNAQKPTYEKLIKALESAPYDYGNLAS